MHQFRFGLEPRQAVEQRLHHGAVAVEQELDIGMAGERNIGARQDDRGTMVAAHSVKRDASLVRHGSTSAALACAPATQPNGFVRTEATITARSRQTSRFWQRSTTCPPLTICRRRGFFSAIPARQKGARRHLRPWAARIGRRPYAGKDRCRGSEIRSPARPGPKCRRPAVPAVRRRRASVLLAALGPSFGPARRRELEVDRLLDRALHRLERHHAGLADPGAHLAADVNAAALACQVEYR